MESMVHAICRVSQCLQWLHLACCPVFSFREISFVVFKYLRCINNANGEMGLRADTEKVATLILGLFSFWPSRKQCVFNYTPKKGHLLDSVVPKHLRAQCGQYQIGQQLNLQEEFTLERVLFIFCLLIFSVKFDFVWRVRRCFLKLLKLSESNEA